MAKLTPASIRNNNPGACEPGYATKKFGATSYEVLRWRSADGKPRENRIATFATPVHGAAAQMHLLATGKHYRGKPLRQAIAAWCGGYSVSTYERVLAAHGGVTPDTVLTKELLADPSFAIPLCRAMARQEAGHEFPMDEAGWLQAHAMAFGDGYAPAPSEANDVPFPKPEAAVRERNKVLTKVGAGLTAAGGVASQAKDVIPPVPQAAKDALANAKELQVVGGEVAAIGRSAWSAALAYPILAGVICIGAVAYWWLTRGQHGK